MSVLVVGFTVGIYICIWRCFYKFSRIVGYFFVVVVMYRYFVSLVCAGYGG